MIMWYMYLKFILKICNDKCMFIYRDKAHFIAVCFIELYRLVFFDKLMVCFNPQSIPASFFSKTFAYHISVTFFNSHNISKIFISYSDP